jgi:hypothetical protein
VQGRVSVLAKREIFHIERAMVVVDEDVGVAMARVEGALEQRIGLVRAVVGVGAVQRFVDVDAAPLVLAVAAVLALPHEVTDLGGSAGTAADQHRDAKNREAHAQHALHEARRALPSRSRRSNH